MTNILQHLHAVDAVHLLLVNDDPRLVDTIHTFLEAERVRIFCVTLCRLVHGPRRWIDVFDHLLYNTWILSDKRTESIVHVAEMILLDSLHDPDYSHEALYYLDALFGIHIKARPLPDGDYYEYIEDRMGNIVNLL